MIDFCNDFSMVFGSILEGCSDEKSIKIVENLRGVLIDFFFDFERYFTASPKAATLDPLENFRVNRGVRHPHQVLK